MSAVQTVKSAKAFKAYNYQGSLMLLLTFEQEAGDPIKIALPLTAADELRAEIRKAIGRQTTESNGETSL